MCVLCVPGVLAMVASGLLRGRGAKTYRLGTICNPRCEFMQPARCWGWVPGVEAGLGLWGRGGEAWVGHLRRGAIVPLRNPRDFGFHNSSSRGIAKYSDEKPEGLGKVSITPARPNRVGLGSDPFAPSWNLVNLGC